MSTSEAAERVIPLFLCVSLAETLDFYRALGFAVTFEQTAPYEYAAVRRRGIDLHLHGRRGMNPNKAYSTCLVVVPRVGPLHRAAADALRARYGRVPTAGLPRITRLFFGQSRFTTFDPSGNRLIHIDHDEPERDWGRYAAPRSRLAGVIENATFLRDTYYEDAAAARLLDKALAKQDAADAPIDRARALAARAELAVALGDERAAESAREELRRIELPDEDRERYGAELRSADDLERWLIQGADVGV